MRQVTIKKIIYRGDYYNRAVKRGSTFKAGEIVKFNTTDGVIIAIVTVTENPQCSKCVFVGSGKCPRFKSNKWQRSCLLCNHHRYGDMNLYFKPLDSILENL